MTMTTMKNNETRLIIVDDTNSISAILLSDNNINLIHECLACTQTNRQGLTRFFFDRLNEISKLYRKLERKD